MFGYITKMNHCLHNIMKIDLFTKAIWL